MSRFIIIAILSALMFGLNFVAVDATGADASQYADPKSLAAFGFILLAAFTIGELAKGVKLPTITGFLIAGVIFGPFGPFRLEEGSDLIPLFLSNELVSQLQLINNLAVGLIALTAGGELRIEALRKSIRAILTIIGAQVAIVLPVVLIAFYLGGNAFLADALGLDPSSIDTTFLIAFGVMIGSLCVGNSPAVSVAIVAESGSEGSFTDMSLGVTIVKDLVVVLLFAIVTAIAVTFVDPEGVFDPLHIAAHLVRELGLSAGVGLLIGVVIWLYLKYVDEEKMLFLVGLIFLGMWFATDNHLEKILVFIAAGFVVENAWAFSIKKLLWGAVFLILTALWVNGEVSFEIVAVILSAGYVFEMTVEHSWIVLTSPSVQIGTDPQSHRAKPSPWQRLRNLLSLLWNLTHQGIGIGAGIRLVIVGLIATLTWFLAPELIPTSGIWFVAGILLSLAFLAESYQELRASFTPQRLFWMLFRLSCIVPLAILITHALEGEDFGGGLIWLLSGLATLTFIDLFWRRLKGLATREIVSPTPPPPTKRDRHLGHAMIEAVERTSAPVFVVFFALQGAALNLGAIWNVLAISLIIFGARIISMIISTRLGTKWAGLGRRYQRHLGGGFLSQAGVTLGLVSIASSDRLNAIPFGDLKLGEDVFTPIMMGVVALNLLVGPVFLGRSLFNAGETAAQREEKENNPDEEESAQTTHDEDHEEETPSQLLEVITFIKPTHVPSPRLQEELLLIEEDLKDRVNDFQVELINRNRDDFIELIEQIQRTCEGCLEHLVNELPRLKQFRDQGNLIQATRVKIANNMLRILSPERIGERDRTADSVAFVNLIRGVKDTLLRFDDNPRKFLVPQSIEDFQPGFDDNFLTRLRKRIQRFVLRTKDNPHREVDLARLLRFYITGPLPKEFVPISNMVGHQRYHAWQQISAAASDFDAILAGISSRLGSERPHALLIGALLNSPSLGDVESEPELTEEEIEACLKGGDCNITLIDEASILGVKNEVLKVFKRTEEEINFYAKDLNKRLLGVSARLYRQLVESCYIAGTFQLPDRNTNYSKVADLRALGKEEIKCSLHRWGQITLGYSGRLMTYLDLISLHSNTYEQVTDAQLNVSSALRDALHRPAEKSLERITGTLKELKQLLSPKDDMVAVRARLIEIREDLSDFLTRRAIARLENLRDRGRFDDLLEPFFKGLHTACQSVFTSYSVVYLKGIRLDEGTTPDEPIIEDMPLRELALKRLQGEVAVQLAAVNNLIRGAVDQVITQLSNVQHIISYQLDALISDLGAASEDLQDSEHTFEVARRGALDGLERSKGTLEKMLSIISAIDRQIERMIEHKTLEQLRKLQQMATSEQAEEVRNYLSGAGDTPRKGVLGRIARAKQQARELQQKLIQPLIQDLNRNLNKKLGIKQSSPRSLVEMTDEASFERLSEEHIPVAYKRPFLPIPVDIDEFHVGREAELETVRVAYARFRKGLASSVLIRGESGSGKTTFMDRILHKIEIDRPVTKMTITHTASTEEELAKVLGAFLGERTSSLSALRIRLRNSKTQRVLLIEGMHNLFLRTIGGFDALESFLHLVSETSHVFFWVVSVDADAAHYLGNVLPIHDFFTQELTLKRRSPAALRRLIEARHNVSGYTLRFLPPNHNAHTDPSEDEEEHTEKDLLPWLPSRRGASQEHLSETFFADLAAASHGNTILAFFYWLHSIHSSNKEEHLLEIAPLRPLDMRFLQDMEIERKIALSNLIIHDGLTPEELAKVSRLPENTARAMITGLVQGNILNLDRGKVDTYYVNPILFAPIVDHLREQRIL